MDRRECTTAVRMSDTPGLHRRYGGARWSAWCGTHLGLSDRGPVGSRGRRTGSFNAITHQSRPDVVRTSLGPAAPAYEHPLR